MAVITEAPRHNTVERPFVEQLTDEHKSFMYRGLAAIRGQYKEDPDFKGPQQQVAHFLQIASAMVTLGLKVPIGEDEAAGMKAVWDGSNKTKFYLPFYARELGLQLEPDAELIRDSSTRLNSARLNYYGPAIASNLVDLKLLGVDAMSPKDAQVIDREMAKLRRKTDFINTGRLLPTIAADAKLLGMDFEPTPKEWEMMKQEIHDKFNLEERWGYDKLFWFTHGAVDLAIIDSKNPRVEDGKIVL